AQSLAGLPDVAIHGRTGVDPALGDHLAERPRAERRLLLLTHQDQLRAVGVRNLGTAEREQHDERDEATRHCCAAELSPSVRPGPEVVRASRRSSAGIRRTTYSSAACRSRRAWGCR